MPHMRMHRAVEQVVMDHFILSLTCWASWGVCLADTMQKTSEGHVSCMQLHEHTGLGSGQSISSSQKGGRQQLSINFGQRLLGRRPTPKCLPAHQDFSFEG